ncbi:MAG: hypothetical protein GY809_00055, partial [Planctomycetes bacterium]|nr:hypothetical protein [Planctomycetota bacterium]
MASTRNAIISCTLLTIIMHLCISPGQAEIDLESLAGVWLFDEGTGTIAKDNSGHGYDAE